MFFLPFKVMGAVAGVVILAGVGVLLIANAGPPNSVPTAQPTATSTPHVNATSTPEIISESELVEVVNVLIETHAQRTFPLLGDEDVRPIIFVEARINNVTAGIVNVEVFVLNVTTGAECGKGLLVLHPGDNSSTIQLDDAGACRVAVTQATNIAKSDALAQKNDRAQRRKDGESIKPEFRLSKAAADSARETIEQSIKIVVLAHSGQN